MVAAGGAWHRDSERSDVVFGRMFVAHPCLVLPGPVDVTDDPTVHHHKQGVLVRHRVGRSHWSYSLRCLSRSNVSPGSGVAPVAVMAGRLRTTARSEEHTSELQSLMRISYAVFCLKKKR